MVDIEYFQRLMKLRKSASEIADALGVSRMRVYQIAKEKGLNFKKAKRRKRVKSEPKPRLITGGVAVTISETAAGKVSELLVAADLTARGWQVFLPVYQNKGHDLIAARYSRLISIEVRSAKRNKSGNVVYAKKTDSFSHIHALVITGEPVVYEPNLPN